MVPSEPAEHGEPVARRHHANCGPVALRWRIGAAHHEQHHAGGDQHATADQADHLQPVVGLAAALEILDVVGPRRHWIVAVELVADLLALDAGIDADAGGDQTAYPGGEPGVHQRRIAARRRHLGSVGERVVAPAALRRPLAARWLVAHRLVVARIALVVARIALVVARIALVAVAEPTIARGAHRLARRLLRLGGSAHVALLGPPAVPPGRHR